MSTELSIVIDHFRVGAILEMMGAIAPLDPIKALSDVLGSNGLDSQNVLEVSNLADMVSRILGIDGNNALRLVNALIETGNLTQGMSGEDVYYVLNGPRYSALGANPSTDDFISQWHAHDNKQFQIDELSEQIQTFNADLIAGPTNEGQTRVWRKGEAIAHSLALMMGADPFEVSDIILNLHRSGHLTESATADDVFALFDFNHDSIIDRSDLELYKQNKGDVDSFHQVLLASNQYITDEQIKSIINDPVQRNNPYIVQNLVDNANVSDDFILELLLPHDRLNASGTGFETTVPTEEIISIVASSERFKNTDIAGAIYHSENTSLTISSQAADILGIPPLPEPTPIGYPKEVREGGLWHRAKEWFDHVEAAVQDEYSELSGLEDDFFNQFGTAGELAGFIEGAGVEAIEFVVMAEVLAAVLEAVASAGFTVVAAGAAVTGTEISIEELIAHIKDPNAGHLTGPLGSTIKSIVESVASSAKDLITDLTSNISTLLNSGYVLVVPEDKGERARYVNPNTESGAAAIKQLLSAGAKLYANEHTQDKFSDTYTFEGTTEQFKHEHPFEHGVALGHFVGEAIQEVFVLKDIAKLALNAGKTGVEAIVDLFKGSTAEDLDLLTQITNSSGETFSPGEYANLLRSNSNPNEAFNDFLKLDKDEQIAVRHEGYKPQPPLEITSDNFLELNTLLQNNNITAEFTFNSNGNLEIYLKDSAGLTVSEDERLDIQGKIEEHLGQQLYSSSVKEGSFHWLEPNDAVPSENYKAAIVGKGGNLEGLNGGLDEDYFFPGPGHGEVVIDADDVIHANLVIDDDINLNQDFLTAHAAETYKELETALPEPPTGYELPGGITIGKQIGSGTTGIVYEATGPGGEKYVVKTSSNPVGDYHEQAVLDHLSDVDGVMQTHDTFIEPPGPNGEPGRLWAVREFLPKDLTDVPYSTAGGQKLLTTLTEVHGEDVAHQDLLPENIRFKDDGTPTLIDFGRATTITKGQENTIDMGGNPQKYGPVVHDINSAGFTLWQWKHIDVFGGSEAGLTTVMATFADKLESNYMNSLKSLGNDELKTWLTDRGVNVPQIVDVLESRGKVDRAHEALLKEINNHLTPAETQTRENIMGATGLTEDALTEEDKLLLDMMTATDGTAQQFLDRYNELLTSELFRI